MTEGRETDMMPVNATTTPPRTTAVPEVPEVGGKGGEATTAAAAPTPARVLMVDDEPAIVDAVTYNLRQQGYIPLIASDADAALRLFREKQPDLIILDVML